MKIVHVTNNVPTRLEQIFTHNSPPKRSILSPFSLKFKKNITNTNACTPKYKLTQDYKAFLYVVKRAIENG